MPTLQRRTLPGLAAEVSAIGAGCWAVGGPAVNNGVPIGWDHVDPDAAYAGLVRAHELGVTLYDTADVYGLGHSERLLGRLLRHVRRDELVISSKVGYFAGTARHPYDPEQMRRQFATTLDNLGTDYLDIYFLHSDDFGDNDQYLPGAIHVLRELREQGLIRAIGMRAPHTFAEQWATGTDQRAVQTARWLYLFRHVQPNVVTVRYNLLSPLYRAEETDIFDFARRHQVGVLIKQALAQGLLLRDPTALLRDPTALLRDPTAPDLPSAPPTTAAATPSSSQLPWPSWTGNSRRFAAGSGTARTPWPVSRWATSYNTPPTRLCWSASATPSRSKPPSPAWGTRFPRTR